MKENKSMRMKNSIQKKLMAATSMLMVAVIMMVSSTYAWFTLSTAPEVTGITTAVGANGNLEIALANAETWVDGTKVTSTVGDSMNAIHLKNATWGNIVDVSDNTRYGLDKIQLMPAALNLNDTKTGVASSYLQTPEYGADGRVSELKKETYTGTYNTTTQSFTVDNAARGVRAIGNASAMTPRQSAYRNARYELSTSASNARMYAAQSLNNNGYTLANIVIKHATADEKEEYTADDLAVITAVISTLERSADAIKTAINAAIKGYAASAAAQADLSDDEYTLIEGNLILDNVSEGKITLGDASVTLTADITSAIEKYNTIKSIAAAKTAIGTITGEAPYTWAQISEPLKYVVNPTGVNVNGYTVEQLKTDEGKSGLASSVGGGLKVQLPSGSGVYADIADLAGNYSSSIKLNINYNGLKLENFDAKMTTVSGVNPAMLDTCSTNISNLGAPAAGAVSADASITDIYGYAIDMLFRTNAAESNLLLQTAAIDRIYSDNTEDSDTMGGGSSMTFQSTTPGFTTDNVKDLMKNIKIVFMKGDNTNTILAYADLDVDQATVVGSEVTASIRLYETTTVDTVTTKTYLTQENAVITALTQNTVMPVTALVYLDGETIDNTMVANAESSMVGTMNLQFSSSATLVPMKVTALQNQGNSGNSGSTEDTGSTEGTGSTENTENTETSEGN